MLERRAVGAKHRGELLCHRPTTRPKRKAASTGSAHATCWAAAWRRSVSVSCSTVHPDSPAPAPHLPERTFRLRPQEVTQALGRAAPGAGVLGPAKPRACQSWAGAAARR